MKYFLLPLLLLIFQGPAFALTQCDSAAQDAARQYVMRELEKEGYIIEFPGPAVLSFRILSPDEEYIVGVDGPKTAQIYVRTGQKSYYCAIEALLKLP